MLSIDASSETTGPKVTVDQLSPDKSQVEQGYTQSTFDIPFGKYVIGQFQDEAPGIVFRFAFIPPERGLNMGEIEFDLCSPDANSTNVQS